MSARARGPSKARWAWWTGGRAWLLVAGRVSTASAGEEWGLCAGRRGCARGDGRTRRQLRQSQRPEGGKAGGSPLYKEERGPFVRVVSRAGNQKQVPGSLSFSTVTYVRRPRSPRPARKNFFAGTRWEMLGTLLCIIGDTERLQQTSPCQNRPSDQSQAPPRLTKHTQRRERSVRAAGLPFTYRSYVSIPRRNVGQPL